jgi:hypothetical protein
VTAEKRFAWAAAALVGLAVAVVVLAAAVVQPADDVASPATSRLELVEDLMPPRHLTAADIRRGGPTCLHGTTLVVPPGGGCTFIVPNGVHVVEFRRVPGSSGMTINLTQTADTAPRGPDDRDPDRLRFAAVHDGTTVTFSGCRGPGTCRLLLSG